MLEAQNSVLMYDGFYGLSHTHFRVYAIPKRLLLQFHNVLMFSEQPRQNHREYNNLVLNFHIHLALKSYKTQSSFIQHNKQVCKTERTSHGLTPQTAVLQSKSSIKVKLIHPAILVESTGQETGEVQQIPY